MSSDKILVDLKTIRKSKILGKGDFGTTYLFKNMAVKLINLQNKLHEETELAANKLNKECESLTYISVNKEETKCVCPILYGGMKHNILKEGKQDILWMIMPLMQKFELTKENLLDVFSACHVLVKNGYFHNDFHMGNVMLYQDKPIIVDFGLMKKENISNLDDLVIKVLTFTQISTFIDNCNTNTQCISQFMDIFKEFRNSVNSFFLAHRFSEKIDPDGKNAFKFAQSIVQFLLPKNYSPFITLQLTAAALANEFFSKTKCGYHDLPWCSKPEGESVADLIYAIRNPREIESNYRDILKMLIPKPNYTNKDSDIKGDQAKFCRCVLHVMSSNSAVDNPYAVCASSVKTTTGGKSCDYNWNDIPFAEIKAYALFNAKKMELTPEKIEKMTTKQLRTFLVEWYNKKSIK